MNSGQFQPGQEKTPGSGRQKGTPNKPRLNLSHHLTMVMEEEFENVQSNLKRLRTYAPDAYFATLLKLLPYAIPRGGMDAVDQMAEIDARKQRDQDALKRAAERTQAYLAQRAAREREESAITSTDTV